MTLLRIDASILGPISASKELADLVLAEWAAGRPDEKVVTRHLGTDPLPSDAWAIAVDAAHNTPVDQRSDTQKAADALAKEVYDEVISADAVVLAFPLYNWGVSAHVKSWIDLVIAGAVVTGGTAGDRVLEGKPVVLLTTRGGNYSKGTPKEGWDHSTPYLRRVLADAWGAELTVVEREFTLVGIKPELDQFAALGAQLKQTAHDAATAAGKALAAG
ncbi:FMN-dependent NADH-azoreductase [Streptomyces aurantiacus]|uniref:FMN dependent NADH:quinone oxidoreductase n=1 Tax=Streptomyces aurantiacus TaxID=47760 RepID=A0A7G1PAF2_9ACTN|nr:NAD(P)H-dependent oxidoreductase [Streptomyces aurantiacus]BCL30836.1 FMN-dependent NADH-azoreductase [Streptomyces aurantiacus]